MPEPRNTRRSGLYEEVLSQRLQTEIDALAPTHRALIETIDPAESARALANHFRDLLEGVLSGVRGQVDSVGRQTELCNRLIMVLGAEAESKRSATTMSEQDLVKPSMLLALLPQPALATTSHLRRPSFPLKETHLLVNARNEPRIGSELEREIESADSIDLLCSFLLWTGFRELRSALRHFMSKPSAQLRVITTTYMGATQPRVLEELHALGAQLRVSYDTRTTRLHAKAWLLRRETGLHTAFVGSSNLSAAAMTDGLEWNVRIGSSTTDVLRKFEATFENYWLDPSFEPFDPARDGPRLKAALGEAKSREVQRRFNYTLTPHAFQVAILERLEVERKVHGRYRNLVVAATGTGKTLIAAFDFRRYCEEFRHLHQRLPRLLFIAHRKEILRQAQDAFRQVLRDPNFGSLMVDGARPERDDALFASIQSLDHIDLDRVPRTCWDVVVVDEFHHAKAPSYSKWLDHLRPSLLLGLTATPERADGRSVLEWFDGHVAVELRLWDAIEQSLLAPFRYFALKDVVDLSGYWKRDRRQFDGEALGNLLSGHHVRALQVVQAVDDYIEDPLKMRAIGFCVSRAHARFMAEQFEHAGLHAATVLGEDAERAERIAMLRDGRLQALFTVDVLSEGVDVPEVDTALFLRPTDSATVFIQQLGRGLRLHPNKRCLTVLDLVASPDRDFRLERRFMSLLGTTRRATTIQVEEGFPLLPPGCSVQLTDDVRAMVIEALKTAVSTRTSDLLSVLKRLGPSATLADVLQESGLSPSEFYRNRALTSLRRAAGFPLAVEGPDEAQLSKALQRLLGLDDVEWISELLPGLLQEHPPEITPAWHLLFVALFHDRGFEDPLGSMASLWKHPDIRRELAELLTLQRELAPYPQFSDEALGVPLRLHCHYQRRQIETALLLGRRPKLPNTREGVWWVKERLVDVFFVTLRKSVKNFSPSTMYEDYALSPTRFHWQSQGVVAEHHEKARRNIEHRERGITPLLFVQLEKRDERQVTNPYLFLGPLRYIKHTGERPLSIEWELGTPMPAEFFERSRVAV